MNLALRTWNVSPHDPLRSVDLVRFTIAFILFTHVLLAFAHASEVGWLAPELDTRGVPSATGFAWTATGIALAASLALCVRRFVIPGAIAAIALGVGAAALHAPRWYIIGGDAVDGHPGVEFDVLVLACLCAVTWTYWPGHGATKSDHRARIGLEIIRVASAFALLTHGSVFVTWDFAGMRGWGAQMTELGWPCGVALVWSIKVIESVCALLRLARRFVVPACFGHLSYLVPALWIEHRLRWFNLGRDDNGIEFPLTIVVCTVACILAYWPAKRATEAAALISAS